MICQLLFGLFLCVSIVLGTVLSFQVVRSRKRMATYGLALDAAQKQPETQPGRGTRLSCVLPTFTSRLSGAGDGWQSGVLDDLRALLWADAASYWIFLEQERTLSLQTHRGLEIPASPDRVRIDLEE